MWSSPHMGAVILYSVFTRKCKHRYWNQKYQPIKSVDKKVLKNSRLLHFIRLNISNYISAPKWAPLLRIQRWTLLLKFATTSLTLISLISHAASLISLFKAVKPFGFWRWINLSKLAGHFTSDIPNHFICDIVRSGGVGEVFMFCSANCSFLLLIWWL